MPSTSFTADRVAAFRLARHHLKDKSSASLVTVCADVGGIQAQVMSAAELSLWTRRRTTKRDEVRAALWERRELVKTTSMRRTLHLLPARDFPMYIAAMRDWSLSQTNNLLSRIGASTTHVDTMIATVMDALAEGPKTQQELLARAKKTASKGMRVWLQYAWSAMRPAIVEGLIVYGPSRGAAATFVRVDQWLPRQKKMDADEARVELATRFLRAFGPATHRDFTKWSGLPTSITKRVFDTLAESLVAVTVDDERSFVLKDDLAELSAATLERTPKLLPSFDTFLLAHQTKHHLVEPRFYKRVYRNQGWLSPVVIIGGRIVAVWFLEERAKSFTVDVQPFATLDAKVRRGIAAEAEALGAFLGERCEVTYTPIKAHS
ncbi:MAG TPA: winged helix DNA-binding domain-containing protein [Vicinamibacterales bacterium]|nr:winged helix DNA-binding domain-containing protein [Vicinamibacterales bacterium]